MSLFRRMPILLGLALVLIHSSGFAASVPLGMAELAGHSTVILRGRVAAIESKWNEDHTLIVSDVTLKPLYAVAGKVAGPVVVRSLGGELHAEEIGMAASSNAEFAVGEDVIVYLAPEGKRLSVVGGAQGKLLVIGERVLGSEGCSHPADMLPAQHNELLADYLGDLTETLAGLGRLATLPGDWASLEAAIPAEAPAPRNYVYNGLKWGGDFPMENGYWVNVNCNDIGAGGGGTSQQMLSAIQAAAQTWALAPATHFRMTYDGATQSASTGANNRNEVLFRPLSQNGTLAQATWFYWPQRGEIFEADIWINDGYRWDATGAPAGTEFDLQSVIVHEFGHWLSLDHDPSTASVMYYSVAAGTLKRVLGLTDRAGISYIYPGANDSAAHGWLGYR